MPTRKQSTARIVLQWDAAVAGMPLAPNAVRHIFRDGYRHPACAGTAHAFAPACDTVYRTKRISHQSGKTEKRPESSPDAFLFAKGKIT